MAADEAHVPVPRHCPECGSDRYLEAEFERLQNRLARVERAALQAARRAGGTEMRLRLDLASAKASQESLQRKVARQRASLNRLEKKLRERGEQPYAA